jgi:hypothetical protein
LGFLHFFPSSRGYGTGDPVDNRHFMYLLDVQIELVNGSVPDSHHIFGGINFYGCKIDYELKEVAP